MPWGLGATYDDPFVTIQGQLSHRLTSDVNKDLTCKAKDMSFKDEDKVKDLIYKAKAKDSAPAPRGGFWRLSLPSALLKPPQILKGATKI